MLSMRLYRNSATNSGKHCTNRSLTLAMESLALLGVSKYVSGSVSSTNEATEATAMAMPAVPMLFVMRMSTL